jgi:hypothetical protein
VTVALSGGVFKKEFTMARKTKIVRSEQLQRLKNKIEAWRNTRKRCSPMPIPFWNEATELARIHGTAPIAKELRLNYSKLKEKACEKKRPPEKQNHSIDTENIAQFVEIDSSLFVENSTSYQTIIELSKSDGSTMTLKHQGGNGGNIGGLFALCETFWQVRL